MTYSFGKYTIEPDLHELRADGELIPVEPQVFALLLYLVENRSRVVSKDELIEAIWDGRFVSDSAVSSRIKSARQAIGDSGKDQAAIRTLHGRGFRFVAEVSEKGPEPVQTPPAAPPGHPGNEPVTKPPTSGVYRHRALYLIAASVIVVVGALFLFLFLSKGPSQSTGQTRIAVLPVQNATGEAELKWTELGLMSLVQHALGQGAGVASISPGVVLSLTEGLDRPLDGPLDIDAALIEKFENAHNASQIVLSRLSGDVSERRLEYVVYVNGVRGKEKFLIGKDPAVLAGDMARDLVLTASGRRGLTSIDRTISDDPFVLEAYARGRALQLEGKAKESKELFGVASTQEPDNIWLKYEFALSTRMLGDFDEAKTLFSDLLEEAVQDGNREAELAIVNALGITEMRLRDLESAIVHSQRAVVLATELREFEKLGTTLINLGIQNRILKNYEASEDALNRSISAFADAGLPPPVSLLNSLALLKWDMKDLASAETYLNDALEGVALIGNMRAEGAILKNLAELAEVRGQWDLAEERYTASVRVRRQTDDTYGLASSLTALAELSLKQGRAENARLIANELLEMFAENPTSFDTAAAHSIIGESFRLNGDDEESIRHHEMALEIYKAIEDETRVKWEELFLAALGAASSGDAEAKASEIRDWAERNDKAELQLRAQLLLARLTGGHGDLDLEAANLLSALDIARSIPSPEHEGVIAARLGLNAIERNDEVEAATYFGLANMSHPDHFEVKLLAAKREALALRFERAAEIAEDAKAKAGANWSDDNERFLNDLYARGSNL